jgi:nucleotide-binding universal stress UspA family protein
MYKHILVPVDGSDTALQAVHSAAALAHAFGSQVTVLYVIDPFPFSGLGSDFAYGQAEYQNAARAEAKTSTQQAQAMLAQSGVQCGITISEAHSAWRGILDAAGHIGADLIVMSSHGRSGLEKIVLGSVAQRVLSHASLPVLVVR